MSKAMKPDRFTITTKKFDFMKLNEKIIENFVEAGFDVPVVLTKGLEVADKAINQEQEKKSE